MGVFNVVAFLGALVLAVAGGGGVWWWDHHPPVGLHQKVLLWTVGFDLPDSLVTQRDRALAEARAANGRLATLEQASRLRQAIVEPIVIEARAAQAKAAVSRQRIMTVPPQGDACRFAQAIDAIFLETLSR